MLKNPRILHLSTPSVSEAVAHLRTAVDQRVNSLLQTIRDSVLGNNFLCCIVQADAYFSHYKIKILLGLMQHPKVRSREGKV